MGTGRNSGITRKTDGTGVTHKYPRKFNIIRHSTSKVSKIFTKEYNKRFQKHLESIDKIANFFGLQEDDIPNINLHYGQYGMLEGRNTIYGASASNIDYPMDIQIFTSALNKPNDVTTGAHEFVHAVEAKYNLRLGQNMIERFTHAQEHTLANVVVNRAFANLHSDFKIGSKLTDHPAYDKEVSSVMKISVTSVSNYHRSPGEMIAFASEDWLNNGSNASPMSKEIMKELKSSFKTKHQGKNKKASKNK